MYINSNIVIYILFLIRDETRSMTAKGWTNVLKLAPVYACSRQINSFMEPDTCELADSIVDFKVTKPDVLSAWELVKVSMEVFFQFKVKCCSILRNLVWFCIFSIFYALCYLLKFGRFPKNFSSTYCISIDINNFQML